MLKHDGRLQAVIDGLKANAVDVMTFQEPETSAIMATGMASRLYDMTTRDSTTRTLGSWFPSQSLLMAPKFIEQHPDTAQHLVNAFVRSMRFINSHSVDNVIARLPDDYFAKKDRAAEIKYIKNTMPSMARNDYAFSSDAVDLVVKTVRSSHFDDSEEGTWRAAGDDSNVKPDELYTNQFVETAMKAIN